MARAEFYFECREAKEGERTWTSSVCNADDDAMYSLRWRARLRGMQDKGPIDILLAKISIPIVTTSVKYWLGQMHH